jgi:hypothetical protein
MPRRDPGVADAHLARGTVTVVLALAVPPQALVA